MANHRVSVKIKAPISVGKTDLEVVVRQDGSMLGTLLISRGSIQWQPSDIP